MILNNVKFLNEAGTVNIAANGKKIEAITTSNSGSSGSPLQIHFTDAIAFPGLINSHDHLDFNCFTPLGQRKYNNYTEWGNHIHAACKEDINAVLKIPQNLRTQWGVYKNVLSGVTTVVNHGSRLDVENPLIRICQASQNLHSVKFQKRWKWKLNNLALKNKACVIHAGEGVDDQSAGEIDELLKWNLLNRKLIGVHAVAMNASQAKKFTALVWCPESNRLLLDQQADIASLKLQTKLVFGTDSTLTASWDIWQHLRLARSLGVVSDNELFSMITSTAASLWKMNNGAIQTGKDADIVIARTKNGHATWDDFFLVDPSAILMVISKGKIRLFDKTLLPQLNSSNHRLPRFTSININGETKFVEGDLPDLAKVIKKYHPGAIFPFTIS